MLQINGLHKTFGAGTINEKLALKDLSLHLDNGDFLTIIGSNGAGKSTLLNCIAGVLFPDSGQIKLAGEDITTTKEHIRSRNIGRVFQDPLMGTAHAMTIAENMAIAMDKNTPVHLGVGVKKGRLDEFRQHLGLLGLGLEDRIHEKVQSLSGGQRQALTLLMATMTHPKLLLLDEHTAALDPGIARKVLELTDRFASVDTERDKMCTIMITHNMKAALEHGNRTVVMKEGQIVMELSGQTRKEMTVEKLVELFSIDNDRMLI